MYVFIVFGMYVIIANQQRVRKTIKQSKLMERIQYWVMILQILRFASSESRVEQLGFLQDGIFLGLVEAIHFQVSIATKWSTRSCLCLLVSFLCITNI